MKQLCRVALAFLASIALVQCRSASSGLNAVHVNGVDLHYVDIGKGTPLVFVHGALLDDFNARLMMPTREAFRSGKPDDVLRVAITYFVGSPDAYDHIPPEFRDRLRGNIAEWEAITTSSNAFPMIDRAAVHRLPMPVLMLSGEKSYAIGKAIDAELERVLVTEKRVIIPNGTHDMCTEYPAACAAEIKRFLESH